MLLFVHLFTHYILLPLLKYTFTTILRISSTHQVRQDIIRSYYLQIEMALLDMFFLAQVLFVFVVHSSTCHNLDVEYSERVVSDHKGDLFGFSLATSHHKLVIGAPFDDNSRGSIMVDKSVRVKGPEDGLWFGLRIDVNQHFMVVSAQHPYSVYVYQSNSPYDMVARLPLDGHVWSLVISDDNTIAVSHYDYHDGNWLTIYQYDGSSTWNIAKKFKLEDWGFSLAVYGDILAVGVPNASHDQGRVHIFNRFGGEWEEGQTIKHDGVRYFGPSVAIWTTYGCACRWLCVNLHVGPT